MDSARQHRANDEIGRQILEEKLAALRRITATLEGHIDALHGLLASVRGGADPERVRHAFAERRTEAERWLWYLRVQREVMGMREFEPLETLFPIPRWPR